jgi:hypothetical protein
MKTANDEIIYGPVWLSKGERFRPTGAYIYLESRYKELQSKLKKLKKLKKEIKVSIIIKNRKKKPMIENDNNNETGDDGQISSTEGTDKDEEDKVIKSSSIENKSFLSMGTKEIEELQKVIRKKKEE